MNINTSLKLLWALGELSEGNQALWHWEDTWALTGHLLGTSLTQTLENWGHSWTWALEHLGHIGHLDILALQHVKHLGTRALRHSRQFFSRLECNYTFLYKKNFIRATRLKSAKPNEVIFCDAMKCSIEVHIFILLKSSIKIFYIPINHLFEMSLSFN